MSFVDESVNCPLSAIHTHWLAVKIILWNSLGPTYLSSVALFGVNEYWVINCSIYDSQSIISHIIRQSMFKQ